MSLVHNVNTVDVCQQSNLIYVYCIKIEYCKDSAVKMLILLLSLCFNHQMPRHWLT